MICLYRNRWLAKFLMTLCFLSWQKHEISNLNFSSIIGKCSDMWNLGTHESIPCDFWNSFYVCNHKRLQVLWGASKSSGHFCQGIRDGTREKKIQSRPSNHHQWHFQRTSKWKREGWTWIVKFRPRKFTRNKALRIMAVFRNPWKGFHWGGGPLRFPRSTIEALKNLVKDIFFRPPVLAHMVYDVHGPTWAPGNSTCCFALNLFHFFFGWTDIFPPKNHVKLPGEQRFACFQGQNSKIHCYQLLI